MAIIDKTLTFSSGQAITADARSTNTVDLGATGTPVGGAVALIRDVGRAVNEVEVLVTEAFNNLTSMVVRVEVDDNTGFSSAKVVAQSRAYLLAELVLGARLNFPADLPEGTDERYVSLFYDITGTAPTAGKVTAAVVAGRQNNKTGV
jgi:hypothetical protein